MSFLEIYAPLGVEEVGVVLERVRVGVEVRDVLKGGEDLGVRAGGEETRADRPLGVVFAATDGDWRESSSNRLFLVVAPATLVILSGVVRRRGVFADEIMGKGEFSNVLVRDRFEDDTVPLVFMPSSGEGVTLIPFNESLLAVLVVLRAVILRGDLFVEFRRDVWDLGVVGGVFFTEGVFLSGVVLDGLFLSDALERVVRCVASGTIFVLFALPFFDWLFVTGGVAASVGGGI
mmetsp:Transcript_61311/g.72815  ORF Transcript_61311/g.72815 Transcript_61311/m.72815 type:complete len:233 (+) Transcript_61311:668-1366(+)